MSEIRKQAEKLAARPYSVAIFRDTTTDKGGFVYIALNPEIEGCMAQGATMEEAQANLDDVRVDMIEHLITHDLPVPYPAWIAADMEMDGSLALDLSEAREEVDIDNALQSDRSTLQFAVSLKT